MSADREKPPEPPRMPPPDYPFRGDLELTDPERSYRVYDLANHPGVVIRESNIKPFETENGRYSLERWRKLFYELKDVYNIPIPETEFVVGTNNHGQKRMFMITDRVEGINVEDAAYLPRPAARQLENLMYNYVTHLVRKYDAGEEYFSDFQPGQLMYGHTAKDKSDRVYLVDLDLMSSKFNDERRNKPPRQRLLTDLRFVTESAAKLEEKFWPRYDFSALRDYITEVVNETSLEEGQVG